MENTWSDGSDTTWSRGSSPWWAAAGSNSSNFPLYISSENDPSSQQIFEFISSMPKQSRRHLSSLLAASSIFASLHPESRGVLSSAPIANPTEILHFLIQWRVQSTSAISSRLVLVLWSDQHCQHSSLNAFWLATVFKLYRIRKRAHGGNKLSFHRTQFELTSYNNYNNIFKINQSIEIDIRFTVYATLCAFCFAIVLSIYFYFKILRWWRKTHAPFQKGLIAKLSQNFCDLRIWSRNMADVSVY